MTRGRSGPCLGAGPAKVPHPGRRSLIAGEPIEGIRARPLLRPLTTPTHTEPTFSSYVCRGRCRGPRSVAAQNDARQ
jgi:hypothetical protein